MQQRIARIANVLMRHGVDPARKQRWIEDVAAEQTARTADAAAAIRLR